MNLRTFLTARLVAALRGAGNFTRMNPPASRRLRNRVVAALGGISMFCAGAGTAISADAKADVAASTTGAAARPNILLILSDDHSKPHVGCYNNPDIRTPNLDRFAAQGMRFDRAYVASPQCVPSRAAILTGRSLVRIQMTRFYHSVSSKALC